MEFNENQPLVSVVIPTYQAEKYLKYNFKCIELQSYTNYEFIFVDDGSIDDTVSILNEYRNNNKKIKVFQRNRLPKGAPTCRNIGLEKSKGKYIIYIDCDDIFSENFLRQRVEYMEKHIDCDYATFKGGNIFIDCQGNFQYGNRVWGCPNSNDCLGDFLSASYPFSIWNNIYRKSKFELFYWDENLKVYQDFEFAVRTIVLGYMHDFVNNDELDYFYRYGLENNLSNEFLLDSKYESTKYLFDKVWTYICDNKKYKRKFKQYFKLQYTRIILKGTNEQVIDYIDYAKKYLSYSLIIRMKIIRLLKKYIFDEKENIFIKMICMLFESPKKTIYIVFNRVNRFVFERPQNR